MNRFKSLKQELAEVRLHVLDTFVYIEGVNYSVSH